MTEKSTQNETKEDPGTYLDKVGNASVSPIKKASGRMTKMSQYKNQKSVGKDSTV